MNKKPIIKVGVLVSYDYSLLKIAIPQIYKDSDVIVLAIDVNRKTWNGEIFNIDASFWDWLKEIDIDSKIKIYEDDFAISGLSTMENETRERNLLAKFLGQGGWHIQIDSDEYFLNFSAFVQYLKNMNSNPQGTEKALLVRCNWIPIIKKVEGGYIYVDFKKKERETAPFATNRPEYIYARNNGAFNHYTNFYVLHETRSRNEEDLLFKLNNWGHNKDFNIQSYFIIWKALDQHNYKYVYNFNASGDNVWPYLAFEKGNDIFELMTNLRKRELIEISKYKLLIKNSRTRARLFHIINSFKSLIGRIIYKK